MTASEKGGFFAEFRKFISRGSVMDMAVGVIIGAAFKAIIDSLVNDILMPFVGVFINQNSFADLYFYVNGAKIMFGSFLSAIINFLIMALVIFLIIRALNKTRDRLDAMRKKHEPEPEPEPEKPAAPTEAELLAKILAVLEAEKKA